MKRIRTSIRAVFGRAPETDPDALPVAGPEPERREAPDRLVVYGSLMRGLPAAGDEIGAGPAEPGAGADLLDRLGVGTKLRRIGPCRVAGELFDLGPYPALHRSTSGAASVCGELHAILDPSVLDVLDAFEGYEPSDLAGSDYLRECVVLQEPPGVRAWIYVYNRALGAAARVASGDWRRHLAERGLNAHVPDSPSRPAVARAPRPADRGAKIEEEDEAWDS